MTFGNGTYDGADPRRLPLLLGHFAPQVLSATIVLAVIVGLNPIGDGTSALALSLPVLLMGVVIGTWVVMRQHDGQLCEQCMLSMPLNPSEQASRYRARFRTAHAGGSKRFVIPYLLVLLGSNVLSSVYPTRFTELLWAGLQLSMIYLIVAYATHRKLQPWCPQCQGGHEDDDDPVSPDPQPRDYSQLV